MKSKLAIAVTLCGWFFFIAWLVHDYIIFRDKFFYHIFHSTDDYELTASHVVFFLIPFIYTFLGYLINERDKFLRRIKESEEKYRTLALVDELTGIYNRRGFFVLSEQQVKVANRSKRGMLLLFADIDNVKSINDTYGHKEGDRALIDTANIFKQIFRKSDIISRIGGDEFVVLALETSDANADIFLNRLHDSTERLNIEGDNHYKLSLSIGFAYYDFKNPIPLEELIAKADSDMYEKKRGKS